MIADITLIALRRDGGTQSRIAVNEETVEDYAAAMKDGRWEWSPQNALVAFCDARAPQPHQRRVAPDHQGVTESVLASVWHWPAVDEGPTTPAK